MNNYSAFTSKYNGISKRLINEADIINGADEMHTKFAQWDTGATNTCISKEVVDRLNLLPFQKVLIQTPSGDRVVNKYFVSIRLANDVVIKDIAVIGTEIGAQGIDLLIGMGIILLGDFTVSNYNGKTIFSFRIPSQSDLSFL